MYPLGGSIHFLFFNNIHQLLVYCTITYLSCLLLMVCLLPLECKTPMRRDFCLSYSLLYIQCLEQCLVQGRHLIINIRWMNEWMTIQISIKAQGLGVRALTDGGEGTPPAMGRKPSKLQSSGLCSRRSRTHSGAGYAALPISDRPGLGPHYSGDSHCLRYCRRVSWFTENRLRRQKLLVSNLALHVGPCTGDNLSEQQFPCL